MYLCIVGCRAYTSLFHQSEQLQFGPSHVIHPYFEFLAHSMGRFLVPTHPKKNEIKTTLQMPGRGKRVEGDASRLHPSLTLSSCSLVWQVRGSRPLPLHCREGQGKMQIPYTPFLRSKEARMDGALNLRRCCWRSWRWRRRPCCCYRWRPLTCVCVGGGRDHWPAGERQYGPPYGTLNICE